jgi:CRISPR/Cas system-associated exonuclease Cas4 (RecB family)
MLLHCCCRWVRNLLRLGQYLRWEVKEHAPRGWVVGAPPAQPTPFSSSALRAVLGSRCSVVIVVLVVDVHVTIVTNVTLASKALTTLTSDVQGFCNP